MNKLELPIPCVKKCVEDGHDKHCAWTSLECAYLCKKRLIQYAYRVEDLTKLVNELVDEVEKLKNERKV